MRDRRAARQRLTGTGRDDRVHAERDAVEQRIVPVSGQRAQRFETPLQRPLIDRRHLAARAGLDHFQRHAAAVDPVDVILVVGVDAGQHQVRTKTIDRQRRCESRVEIVERSFRQHQQRIAIGERRVCAGIAGIFGIAEPSGRGIEADQPVGAVQPRREPRGRRAVPDRFPARCRATRSPRVRRRIDRVAARAARRREQST